MCDALPHGRRQINFQGGNGKNPKNSKKAENSTIKPKVRSEDILNYFSR